jgi:hypothetical protein
MPLKAQFWHLDMPYRLWYLPLVQKGILVCVFGNLSDVFLKKSFSSQSLILRNVNEFMYEQP